MSAIVMTLALLAQVESGAVGGHIVHVPARSPRFDEIKVGESIVRWEGSFEVYRILDKETIVVTYYYEPHVRLWVLKGWPTKDFADGENVRVPSLTKVDGTHKWGSQTLRVIRPLTDDEKKMLAARPK